MVTNICIVIFTCFITGTYSQLGKYDIKELREVSYDIDLHIEPLGLLPDEDITKWTQSTANNIKKRLIDNIPKEDATHIRIVSASQQPFICLLPVPNDKESAVDTPLDTYNPKYLSEIVAASFYVNQCIEKNNGWWNYELCRGKQILQTHGKKEESGRIENSLGMFAAEFSMPDFQTSTEEQLLYVEEWYTGGTNCDLPDKKNSRKTAVRYQCDPLLETNQAYIYSIDEHASCEYIMIVKVGSLCKLKPFLPPKQKNKVPIVCHVWYSKDQIDRYVNDVIRNNTLIVPSNEEIVEAENKLASIARRRYVMQRTCLIRDGDEKKERNEKRIYEEYKEALITTFTVLYRARHGKDVPLSTMDSFHQLLNLQAVLEPNDFRFASGSYEDEDKSNIWHYFMDPYWDKHDFPYALDHVDISNGYIKQVEKAMQYQPKDAEYRRKIVLNPFKEANNVLVSVSIGIRSFTTDLPTWSVDFLSNIVNSNEDYLGPNAQATVLIDFIDSVILAESNRKKYEMNAYPADMKEATLTIIDQVSLLYTIVEDITLERRIAGEVEFDKDGLLRIFAIMVNKLELALSFVRDSQLHHKNWLAMRVTVDQWNVYSVPFHKYLNKEEKEYSAEMIEKKITERTKELNRLSMVWARKAFEDQWSIHATRILSQEREKLKPEWKRGRDAIVRGLTSSRGVIHTSIDTINDANLLNILSSMKAKDRKMEVTIIRLDQPVESEAIAQIGEIPYELREAIDEKLEEIKTKTRIRDRDLAIAHVLPR